MPWSALNDSFISPRRRLCEQSDASNALDSALSFLSIKYSSNRDNCRRPTF